MIAELNALLEIARFEDYGPNGLQVPGPPKVSTVATGVSASAELFERAAAEGADLLIVHHGLFWGAGPGPIDPQLKRRLRLLFDAEIALAAYHLPLDAHPRLGNNALLAAALGAERLEEPFALHHGQPIGCLARIATTTTAQPPPAAATTATTTTGEDPAENLDAPTVTAASTSTAEGPPTAPLSTAPALTAPALTAPITTTAPLLLPALVERVRTATGGRDPLVFDAGPPEIDRLGVVTGGGSDYIVDAARAGAQAFVTGEPTERVMAQARELGVNYIAAGHYATETFGVRALGDWLAERHGVRHVFLDVPNPI